MTVIQLIKQAQHAYATETGKLPTRLELSPLEMAALVIHLQYEDEPGYKCPPETQEQELYGMRFFLNPALRSMRVYFMES